MNRILIAYTTNAGSTTDVAQEIGEEMGLTGIPVDVRRLEEVSSLEGYAAVVIGGPMIMGWSRAALHFIKQRQDELQERSVAYFFTAMNLTQHGKNEFEGIPLWVDPAAAKPPRQAERLSFKERYALPVNYLQPALKAAPLVKPISAGFFGGRLAMHQLKWWQAAFVLLVVQARPGGSHNRPFIRAWAADLRSRWHFLTQQGDKNGQNR